MESDDLGDVERERENLARVEAEAKNLARVVARYRLFGRVMTAVTVVAAALSAATLLAAIRGIVADLGGRNTQVTGGFFAVSIAASSLVLLIATVAWLRWRGAQLRMSREQLTAVERELRARSTDRESADQTTRSPQVPGVEQEAGGGDRVPPVNVLIGAQDGGDNGGRWNAATIALLLVAVISGVFGIANTLINKDHRSPDCLAYSRRLQELDEHYTHDQLELALKQFTFGAYENECGNARRYIGLLHNSSTTSTAPAAPRTTSTSTSTSVP